ncbi:chemotaxis protein CheW, partial [Lactiplantibacillus plantarum]|uniref:chemotaxis protein CheW n=1 Tax=Lactiplantibacillus plantarum TaxID=1590 RepID=UPI0038521343
LEVVGRLVAMVVDAVDDVLDLDPASLRPVPDVAGAIDRRFLEGLAPIEERMLIVLDIEGLMTSAEMGLVEAALAA